MSSNMKYLAAAAMLMCLTVPALAGGTEYEDQVVAEEPVEETIVEQQPPPPPQGYYIDPQQFEPQCMMRWVPIWDPYLQQWMQVKRMFCSQY